MFCSLCKSSDKYCDSRRKICPIGHVACEKCDSNLTNCPECGVKFINFLCVEVKCDVPRVFITEDPEEPSNLSAVRNHENLLAESDSLLDMLKELNEREGKVNQKDRSRCPSVLGNFEIVDPQPSSSPFLFDDERELLKNFEIYHKPRHVNSFSEIRTAKDGVPEPADRSLNKFSLKSEAVLGHRDFQTSTIIELGFRDVSTSPITDSLKGNNSTLGMEASQDCYPLGSFVASERSNSVLEIYRNPRTFEDSDTAHFTSLTVSSGESTPCNSPPKKNVTSIAHRVKFVASITTDDQIPPQNEHLITFQVNSPGLTASVSSDKSKIISRLPVRCPITNCGISTVPSDFCNHITIDHPYIADIKIAPNKTFNLVLSQKGNPNMVICQRFFLVTGKCKEIGYGGFENCLPVMLLTSKMTMQKAFECSPADSMAQREQLFIFLVGVYQLQVNYTITLWTHGRDNSEPVFIKCMSNSVQFINKPTSLKEIAKNSLNLSQMELQMLSNGGRSDLQCQIVFH